MIYAARIVLAYLVALALTACVAWSASGQTYDPATSGPLHSWVVANGKPGAVLTIPPGTYDLTEPIFVDGFTLAGTDWSRPTQLNLRGHGMLWVGQKAWPTADRRSYVVDGVLRTKPDGLTPATFDMTESGANRPWHRTRKLTIDLELDTPGGKVEPGGLFSFGPFWCWWHPNAPRGPELFLTLGASPFDPVTTADVKLTWDRPAPAERLALRWTIDLDAGTVGLVVNGVDLGTRSIPAGRSFPAIVNRRATLGTAQAELNEIRHRWELPGGVPDRRIRRFEVTDGKSVLVRMSIANAWDFGAWATDGGGPLIPVPYDATLYGFRGGHHRLRDLVLRADSPHKCGVRVGQVMGQARFENVKVIGASVAVRKLPGKVSYTHYFDGFTAEYCGGVIIGHGMTVHGRDWDIRYPRLFGVSLADSNFRLERWTGTAGCEDKAGADIQVVFDFAAASNGGSVSIAGGMWNDESGRVAMGAFLHYLGGSRDTSSARLIIEDSAINVPGFGRPAYWLRSMPAARPAAARIFASHWGAPLFDIAPNWTVEGPERPVAPATSAPVTP